MTSSVRFGSLRVAPLAVALCLLTLSPAAQAQGDLLARCGYDDELWLAGQHSSSLGSSGSPTSCSRIWYPDAMSTYLSVPDSDWRETNSGLGWATDIGISVFIPPGASSALRGAGNSNGRSLFYMGDTWPTHQDKGLLQQTQVNDTLGWCSDASFTCYKDAQRNDAIGESLDTNPQDGVDLTLFTKAADKGLHVIGAPFQVETFLGMGIPAVHGMFGVGADYWSDENGRLGESRFSTPTGAVYIPAEPGSTHPEDMVLAFYAISGLVGAGPTDDGWESYCAQPEVRRTPQVFAAVTKNGVDFHDLYKDYSYLDRAVPFSKDGYAFTDNSTSTSETQDCINHEVPDNAASKRSKFIGISPVWFSKADYALACNQANQSTYSPLMCELGGPGVILYGEGRPAGRSPLYLGFIRERDLGKTNLWKRPLVKYYVAATTNAAARWSDNENDASPLPEDFWAGKTVPCSRMEDYQYNGTIQGIPEMCKYVSTTDPRVEGILANVSASVIRAPAQTLSQPQVLLLYNTAGLQYKDAAQTDFVKANPIAVRYRTAPITRPWDISEPSEDLLTESGRPIDGYTPKIIDRFTNAETAFHAATGELSVWHTISSWRECSFEANPATCNVYKNTVSPYGIYTRETRIEWPPAGFSK